MSLEVILIMVCFAPLYIAAGAVTVEVIKDFDIIKNPLWYLPTLIFFPIVLLGLLCYVTCSCVRDWFEDVVEYYKEKRNE